VTRRAWWWAGYAVCAAGGVLGGSWLFDLISR
jgi:hypothetical protein